MKNIFRLASITLIPLLLLTSMATVGEAQIPVVAGTIGANTVVHKNSLAMLTIS